MCMHFVAFLRQLYLTFFDTVFFGKVHLAQVPFKLDQSAIETIVAGMHALGGEITEVGLELHAVAIAHTDVD